MSINLGDPATLIIVLTIIIVAIWIIAFVGLKVKVDYIWKFYEATVLKEPLFAFDRSISKIEDMVNDLEPGPKTTEIKAELDYTKDILKALEDHNREMKEEFERDREPIPLPKRIVNSILDDIPVTIFWFLVSAGLILLSLLF